MTLCPMPTSKLRPCLILTLSTRGFFSCQSSEGEPVERRRQEKGSLSCHFARSQTRMIFCSFQGFIIDKDRL